MKVLDQFSYVLGGFLLQSSLPDFFLPESDVTEGGGGKEKREFFNESGASGSGRSDCRVSESGEEVG